MNVRARLKMVTIWRTADKRDDVRLVKASDGNLPARFDGWTAREILDQSNVADRPTKSEIENHLRGWRMK